MQQRLNNRWLSEELIEAVRPAIAERHTPAQTPLVDDFGSRSELHSTRQGHRRMWQHLATALLLVGSAAFSYLAWSQAELAPGSRASAQRSATPPQLLNAQRANVHALRVSNRELQLRIAELQKAIDSTTP